MAAKRKDGKGKVRVVASRARAGKAASIVSVAPNRVLSSFPEVLRSLCGKPGIASDAMRDSTSNAVEKIEKELLRGEKRT